MNLIYAMLIFVLGGGMLLGTAITLLDVWMWRRDRRDRP